VAAAAPAGGATPSSSLACRAQATPRPDREAPGLDTVTATVLRVHATLLRLAVMVFLVMETLLQVTATVFLVKDLLHRVLESFFR
jgi:hypothetical protein